MRFEQEPFMSEALTENIKTRVPPSIKRGFKRIAKARHLKVSDIHRDAVLLANMEVYA